MLAYLVSFTPISVSLVYLVSFTPQNGCAILRGPPISWMLVYLVPLARSRYCASPEASIMRLKAAPTLGLGLSFAITPKTSLSSILNSPLSASAKFVLISANSWTDKKRQDDASTLAPRNLRESECRFSGTFPLLRLS